MNTTSAYMRAMLIVAFVVQGGCFAAGGTWGSSGKSEQRTPLVTPRRARVDPSKLRVLKIHVYVGHRLLSQRVSWRRQVRHLLRQVNELVEPALHLRLQLATTTRWQRSSNDDDLSVMMNELRKMHAPGPRELVVGMVTPLALMEPSIHKLGLAEIGGSYMVLRAGRETAGLSSEGAEQAVFIHELGHLLGVGHSKDRRDYMYPALGPGMNKISSGHRIVMYTNVGKRLRARKSRARVAPAPVTPQPKPKPSAKTAEYKPRYPGLSEQQADDAFAKDIANSDKQLGGIALMELRGLDGQLTRRGANEKVEQDRLWILLARTYVKRFALTWAGRALSMVRSSGVDAVKELKARIAALRKRHRPPKNLDAAAESQFYRRRVKGH